MQQSRDPKAHQAGVARVRMSVIERMESEDAAQALALEQLETEKGHRTAERVRLAEAIAKLRVGHAEAAAMFGDASPKLGPEHVG